MLSKDLGLHSSFQIVDVSRTALQYCIFGAPTLPRLHPCLKPCNGHSVGMLIERKMQLVCWQCQGRCGDGVTGLSLLGGWERKERLLLEVPKVLRPSLCSPLVIWELKKGKKFYLQHARRTPGSLLTSAHGDMAAYITTSTAASLVQAPDLAKTLAVAFLPVSHSFLACYKSIQRKRQGTWKNQVMRVNRG